MEAQSKLTLDIIADYIRLNLNNFVNTDEIIIIKKSNKNEKVEHKSTEKSKQKSNEKKEKQYNNLDEFFTLLDKTGKEIFPIEFIKTISKEFVDLFDNFFLIKPISDFLIDEKEYNYSFYSAILTALNDNYSKESTKYKLESINNLMSYMKSDMAMDGFKNYNYSKLKWTKNQIIKDINSNTISDKIIRCISDILHINIFLINSNNIEYYGGDFLVFKKILILFKYNENYYIISDNENKYFHFNSNELIKSILINNQCIKLKLCEKFNSIGYEKINNNEVKKQKPNEIEYTDRLNGFDSETESETKSNKSDKSNKSNKSNKLEKEFVENDEINHNMSLIELQKKAKELNIDTFYFVDDVRKMKNKKELCTEIISYKNKKI